MFASTRNFLNRQIQSWARRRQGPDGDVVRLDRRRIYILPSRQGLLFGATLFVMLLSSMNYSNSMGFMLTFVLTGLGFVAMYACHANLAGLEISAGKASPVFAGETARFHLHVTNLGRAARIAITLSAAAGDTTVTGDVEAVDHGSVAVPLVTDKRGWLKLDRLVVETTYPFGLFRAWSWVYMNLQVLVYPNPADNFPPLPPPQGGRGGGRHTGRGQEDFSGLRGYRPGDSPRHIAWKASAREQKLLTKQFTGSGEEQCWLDWEELTGLSQEERLSVLCRWVLMAHAENLNFGLRLPSQQIPVSGGDAHRDRCLKMLALFGLRDGRRS
ncbi:MAG: DUF58 domain-containing protein [Gammaproteobacteria bacterium]